MKQFNSVKNLIFDFGGVLINLDLPQCIQNIKDLGIPDVEQYLSNFGQKEFFLDYEKGNIDTPTFRNEIRKLAEKPIEDSQIDAAWCSFLCDIPLEKLELLTKLREKYNLYLLSNTNPLHIEVSAAGEFAKVGKTIHDFFDKCYLSFEMKMVKPDIEIFKTMLSDSQLVPDECLFLDDGQKNIEIASSLGIRTYLVSPHENLDFLLNIN